MPETDPYLVRKSPRDVVLSVARGDNIPNDVAEDFLKVTGGIESGSSHYWRNGKVKTSPVDPKDGQRAIGFSQIKPATARSVGVTDPYNETENIKAGLRYFAKGGNDPVRRRIAYFSGTNSKAAQYYDRTGKIPSGGDFTGTSFTKYVTASGGLDAAQDPYLIAKPATSDPYLIPKTPKPHPALVKLTPRKPAQLDYAQMRQQSEYPAEAAPSQSNIPKVEDILASARGGRREPTFEEDRVQRIRQNAPQKLHGMGELRAAEAPEVTRVQRIQGDIARQHDLTRQINRSSPNPAEAAGYDTQELVGRLTTERTQEERSARDRPEIDRLAQSYRDLLKGSARMGGSSWINETLAQGSSGLAGAGAAFLRTGKFTPLGALASAIADTPDKSADLLNLHAQAIQQAAEAEGADRNEASKIAQNVIGGFIASTPELAAMGLGLPAPLVFAAGSGARAYGAHKPVVPAAAQGLLTGAAYELPVEGALAKAGTVGATTAGIDLASGASPREALQSGVVNALMAGTGVRGDRERASITLNPRSETNALRIREPETIPLAETPGDSETVGQRIPESGEVTVPQEARGGEAASEVTTPHHSQSQLRRVRNTASGTRGQFKKGQVPAEAQPTASMPEEVSPSVAGFKTSQGSTYTVNGQSTQRTKSLHQMHDKADVGLKEPSERTVYVSPEDATRIGAHTTLNKEAKPTVRFTAEGIVLTAKYGREPDGRTYTRTKTEVIPYTSTPEVGRAPVEFLPRGKVHAGNDITEITPLVSPSVREGEKPRTITNSDAAPPTKPFYHATSGDFDEFRAGTHFGTAEAANARSKYSRAYGPRNVRPVKLKIDNPLRVEDDGTENPLASFIWSAEKQNAISKGEADSLYRDKPDDKYQNDYPDEKRFYDLLKSKGYDGLVYENATEDYGEDSYVIFDNSQAQPALSSVSQPSPQGEVVKPEVKGEPNVAQSKPVSEAENQTPSSKVVGGETPPPTKERSFPKTLESTGREGGTDRTYEVFGDKESRRRADARITKDPEAARDYVLQGSDAPETTSGKERIVTGLKLADQFATEAENASDPVVAAEKHAQAIDLYNKLSVDLTSAGQTVQAASQARKYSVTGAPLEVVRIAKKNGQTPKAEDIRTVREMAKRQDEMESRLAEVQSQIESMQAKVKDAPKTKTTAKTEPKPRVKIETLTDRLSKMEGEARARLAARTGVKGSQAGASTIPLDIADYAIIGAVKIAKGGLNYASWSKAMIDEFGESVNPQLEKIFTASHKLVNEQRANLREASAERSASKELGKGGQAATPEAIADLRQKKYELQVQKRQNARDMDRKFKELEARNQGGVKGAIRKVDQIASTVLRDGLLSFHGLFNILGGMTAKQALDTAGRIPESALDIARVRGAQMLGKTVPRTSAGLSLKGLTESTKYFVTKGVTNIGKSLAGRPSEVMPETFKGPFESPWANAAIGPMGKLYGAKESIIRSWAYPTERQNQASVMAHNDMLDGVIKRPELNRRIDDYLQGRATVEGSRNKQYVQSLAQDAAEYEVRNKEIIPSAKEMRARELAKNPSQLIDAMASQYADKQVYAEPLGARLQKLQRGLKGGLGSTGESLVLPFLKRPANSIKDLLYTYTGVRVPVEAVRNSLGRGWGPAEIRSFNQAAARGGTGPVLFAVGFALAARGMMTSQNDKEHPGSLIIGGKYYAISRVPVAGWLLSAGATANKDGGKAVPAAMVKMIAEHPLLRGIKNLASAVDEGVKASEGNTKKLGTAATSFAGKTMSRVIPTPIAATAETLDTQNRDTRGLLGPTMARIPGLRPRLPARGSKERLSAFDPFLTPPIRLKPRTSKSAFQF